MAQFSWFFHGHIHKQQKAKLGREALPFVSKTKGSESDIPLTAHGFKIAWDNLNNQYENKRILINTQLRNLFNVAHCGQESASGIKKLQRDVTNCISVLEF